jgi:hypothetical protein
VQAKTSLKGQVGLGGEFDPVESATTFQHNLLVGLGGLNERLRIFVDDVPLSNWGQNSSFAYDSALGLITWTNGYSWQLNSSFEVPLNQ